MSSRNEDEQNEYLICGYIRNVDKTLSLSYDFPKGIINIIILHYPRLDFRFRKAITNKITVSDDGLELISKDIIHSVRFGEFVHVF